MKEPNEAGEAREPEHELLCRYVLGDATEQERREAQALIEASPERAAEAERLSATIGLVRTSLPEGDALSEATRERILAAARRPRPLTWHSRLLVRAAAALVVLVPAGYLLARDVGWLQREEAAGSAPYSYHLFGEFDADPQGSLGAGVRTKARGEGESNLNVVDIQGFGVGAGSSENAYLDPAAELAASDDALDALKALGYLGGSGEEVLEDQESGYMDAIGYFEPAAEDVSLPARTELGLQEPSFSSEELELLEGLGYLGQARGPSSSSPTRDQKSAPPGRSKPVERLGRGRDHVAFGQVASNPAEPVQYYLSSTIEWGRAGGFLAELGHVGDDQGEEQEQLRALGYAGEGGPPAPRFYGGRNETQMLAYLDGLRPNPGERPKDLFFRYWGDNAFVDPMFERFSTFAVDVDTASYALARRLIREGYLPPSEGIRTEEFLNYFKPDEPAPQDDVFAIGMELAPSPFGSVDRERWLLRVSVRGREVSRERRQPLALTLVVDVSGSMRSEGRLGLVQDALRKLTGSLDAHDSVALVTFSNQATERLPRTSAAARGMIEDAIAGLAIESGTNAAAGLTKGYRVAAADFDEHAVNRVVFLSDGVANLGETDQEKLTEAVSSYRERGIFLNTVGVGLSNHDDDFLEQLADNGDGLCNYIDSPREAERALVENFTGAFEPIARDVKIQLEFDPEQVERYRLLGYENRKLEREDFRNDAVDAGEIGAGHQVTALYEIERSLAGLASRAPLATARLRFKAPERGSERAREVEASTFGEVASSSFAASSLGFRRAAVVAQFAEFLRLSVHSRDDSVDHLLREARNLAPLLDDPDFDELLELVGAARDLALERALLRDPREVLIDELRHEYLEEARLAERLQDTDADESPELHGALEKELALQRKRTAARTADLLGQLAMERPARDKR